MDRIFIQRIWKIDDLDSTKGTAIWTDAAASAEKFINARFFPRVITRENTICPGAVDRAQFSTEIISTFHRVAFFPVNDCQTFTHRELLCSLFYIPFGKL